MDMATAPDLAAGPDLATGDLAPASDLGPRAMVQIAPATAMLGTGQSLPFSAKVMNAAPGTYFYVSPGGAGGTIDATGHYRAPFVTGTDEVIAASLSDPSATASATVTIVATPQVMISLAPGSAFLNPGQRQTFTASVSGNANTGVFFSVEGGGTIDSNGVFTAGDVLGSYKVSATSQADPDKSATATVTITSDPQVSVTVSPAPVTLTPGQSQSFFANVTPSGNQAVTWSASGGSIDSGGHYIAPPVAGRFRVTATSQADPDKSDSAVVIVPATELSGTVSYSGPRRGRVYVNVTNNGNGLAAGTSLPSPGPFTIHGAPTGPLHIRAWIDTLGVGSRNGAADPTGTTDVTLPPSAILDGISLLLVDPSITTPTTPAINFLVPTAGGLIAVLRQPTDNSNAEVNDHYRVYCSTTSTPNAGNSVIRTVLPGSNLVTVAPLATGMWTCAASGFVGGTESALSSTVSVPVGPPPASGSTLSGKVLFPGITPTGTLYVIAIGDMALGAATSLAAPVSPQSYVLGGLPNSQYQMIALLDQGDDGYLGPTDPALLKVGSGLATVSGNSTAPPLAFPTGDAWVRALTTNDNGAGSVRLTVTSAQKQPVAATLLEGPGVGVPTDFPMDQKIDLNGQVNFAIGPNVSPAPSIGDAYSVDVLFSDGTRERMGGAVSAFLAPPIAIGPSGTTSATPTFTWSAPSPAPSSYYYSLRVETQNGGGGFGDDVIPPSVTSFSGHTLSPGNYRWVIIVHDADDNQSQVSTNFTIP
jgi:hypothetical protein